MPLVISPHLDDAVPSCGRWIAAQPGCAVVTLFAGVPCDPSWRTGWDAQCGFASAGEAIAARRQEDTRARAARRAAALARLRRRPVRRGNAGGNARRRAARER